MADLITLDTYKQTKALKGAQDDERLSLLVDSVNQLVKTYCGNTFNNYVTTDRVEYHSIDWDTCRVQLDESPIISVTTVEVREDPAEDYGELTADTEYTIDNRTDTVVRVAANWPKGTQSVKITYKAGYATLPADLNLALVDLITYYFKEEHKVTRQLSGATMTNMGTSSLTMNVGFPDHIKRVLDMYRQI